MKIKTAKELKKYINQIDSSSKSTKEILVSLGTCGIAAGTEPILKKINSTIKKQNLQDEIKINEVGCMGLCHSEPTIEVVDKAKGTSYIFGNLQPEQVENIIEFTIGKKKLKDTNADQIAKNWYYPEDPSTKKEQIQTRIVLKNCGRINPESIDEYIQNSGYEALNTVLEKMQPTEVINLIEKSGLRGRGGGGFPTGIKWKFAAKEDSKQKYVVCNADEGDPGAFMDRAVLEGDPHAVLEAMAITGYAIGANNGVIYIRAEYPLAIRRLELAIKQAKKIGFLGKNIFDSKFSFDLQICYGAGAFVCGEETALIASIEGKRGMPNFKPPFPAVSGLNRKPTIVNNVETFANIPSIVRNGSEWFKKIGTEGSPGTKVFALAGKINKVGLIEVPMGIKLKEIIYDIGGGIMDNKKFKAVQTGGPSGGCITEKNLDTQIDYESLKKLGSMMGSGGMIVMDEDDCMVDVAKFFLEFTMDESCGKCIPCRIGGVQMYKILEQITKGNGKESDIEKLEKLAKAIKMASLCGLGQTSPNPVLATLKNFKKEYIQHIKDKKCKAKRCTDLLTYEVIDKNCVGCTACAKKCPVSCISGKVKEVHHIDQELCIRCGACFDACKFKAISKG